MCVCVSVLCVWLCMRGYVYVWVYVCPIKYSSVSLLVHQSHRQMRVCVCVCVCVWVCESRPVVPLYPDCTNQSPKACLWSCYGKWRNAVICMTLSRSSSCVLLEVSALLRDKEVWEPVIMTNVKLRRYDCFIIPPPNAAKALLPPLKPCKPNHIITIYILSYPLIIFSMGHSFQCCWFF